ncbi:hypothetical protein GN958_ATG00965, partial [Phytophthora infestans]
YPHVARKYQSGSSPSAAVTSSQGYLDEQADARHEGPLVEQNDVCVSISFAHHSLNGMQSIVKTIYRKTTISGVRGGDIAVLVVTLPSWCDIAIVQGQQFTCVVRCIAWPNTDKQLGIVNGKKLVVPRLTTYNPMYSLTAHILSLMKEVVDSSKHILTQRFVWRMEYHCFNATFCAERGENMAL